MKMNYNEIFSIKLKPVQFNKKNRKKILEILLLLLLFEYCQEINMSEHMQPVKFLKVLKTKIDC